MKLSTHLRVQEHLSSEGIFLLGDAQQQGFPIRYASPGFEQVYGYTSQEIVGRKCGDLIGGPMILKDTTILASAATASGTSLQDAETKVRFLVEKAGEACRVMMANPGERVGVALLLNRRKNGELFVCECLVLNLQHPTLDWSYCVGFQRDVTKEVPIPALFAACAPGEYSRLLQSRAQALEARRLTLLGVGSKNVMQYLHEKALSVFTLDIWRTLRTALFASGNGAEPQAPTGTPPDTNIAGAPAVEAHRMSDAHVVPSAGSTAPGTLALGEQPLSLLHAGAQGQLAPAAVTAPVHCQQICQGTHRSQSTSQLPVQASGCQGTRVGIGGDFQNDSCWKVLQSNSAVSFLTEAGLFQYAESLLLNGFDDLEAVLHMNDEDIEAVGLVRGHAQKLKRKIKEFKCLQICAPSSGSEHHANDRLCPPSPDGASINSSSPKSTQTEVQTAAEQSWQRVRAVGVEAVGEAMMRTFFKLSCDAEEMFSKEVCAKYWDWDASAGVKPSPTSCQSAALRKMSAKILNLVGNSVAGQHNMQQLVPMLVELGMRHGSYGAREEHFALLGKALTRTLREVLGEEDFPPEAERAWSLVYNFVSATMLGGALGAVQLGGPMEKGSKVPSQCLAASDKQIPAPPLAKRGTSNGSETLLQQLHGNMHERMPRRANSAT